METDQFFITRKRKKWKFAHFAQWPNCFEAEDVEPQQWKQPLVLEVGAGTADLAVGLARLRPGEHYIAVDVKADRLYTGAKIALAEKLDNIAFVRAHLEQLPAITAPRSVRELWITFPDPFPRKKQARRRLTHPKYLQFYEHLLTSGGVVRFKTDNRELFLWSLEQIIATGWQIVELSFDLHESDLSESYKITTRYERKFMAEGIQINFVSFVRP